MLDQGQKRTRHDAILALRQVDGSVWQALAPLSNLSAQGTDVSIDFSTEPLLGAPVIIARPAAAPRPALARLTSRQTELLQAMARGLSNKAIARALGKSPATVKDHVRFVLSAFCLQSRSEVIVAYLGSKTD